MPQACQAAYSINCLRMYENKTSVFRICLLKAVTDEQMRDVYISSHKH